MQLAWEDYGPAVAEELAQWQDEDTLRFAIGSTIASEHHYYISSPDYMCGESYFCKTVRDGEALVGVVFLLCGEGHPATINPIIVNPALRGRGYCARILMDLATHTKELLHREYRVLQAGISLANTASIKAFEKVGFVRVSTHPDGDFATWQYAR